MNKGIALRQVNVTMLLKEIFLSPIRRRIKGQNRNVGFIATNIPIQKPASVYLLDSIASQAPVDASNRPVYSCPSSRVHQTGDQTPNHKISQIDGGARLPLSNRTTAATYIATEIHVQAQNALQDESNDSNRIG
jgi:hypothetical protein